MIVVREGEQAKVDAARKPCTIIELATHPNTPVDNNLILPFPILKNSFCELRSTSLGSLRKDVELTA